MAGRTTLKEYLARLSYFFTENRRNVPRGTPDRRSDDHPMPRSHERRTFEVVIGSKFNESLVKHSRVFSDLHEKLKRFIDIKQADPLHGKYGKHDSPFSPNGPLRGYMHCHLRDDAILIYTLKNQSINLIMICNHSDVEGAKQQRTAKALTM